MPIFDHFSLLAPFYEKFIKPRSPERLVQLAGLPVEGALLDAGGGTGRVSHTLAAFAGLRVVADGSLGMLAQARSKDGLALVCSYTERLPFADQSIERVIMVDALHHVENQQRTGAELWRVLKPGGRILIEEPNIHLFGVKVLALAEKLALMRSHIISHERIRALLPEKGARVEVVLENYFAWVIIDKLAEY